MKRTRIENLLRQHVEPHNWDCLIDEVLELKKCLSVKMLDILHTKTFKEVNNMKINFDF